MHIFGPGMAAVEAARGLSILGTEAHGRVTTNHVHLYQRHKYSAEASAKQLDEDIAKAKAYARHEEEVEGGTLVTARDASDEEDNDELRKLETPYEI